MLLVGSLHGGLEGTRNCLISGYYLFLDSLIFVGADYLVIIHRYFCSLVNVMVMGTAGEAPFLFFLFILFFIRRSM